MSLKHTYTVGASTSTIWGDGFLERRIIDYAGGFVIHLSSGVAGFTAAYWVGPRQPHDRQNFPPNSIIHMLGGAGFLWLGWTGFNGGSPFAADLVAFHWPFSTLIFALQPASWDSGTMGSAIDGSNVWFGATSLICILISRTVDLRMKEDDQEIGDDAVHGEEAYARWGDGEWMPGPLRLHMHPRLPSFLLPTPLLIFPSELDM
ncbi:AMMONIUM TRANSPORTER [Salix purpurea]|uniref:AMMONIUM TRANSPORTER n=1 Tax=Salix purpurea TaxID=77065 RepID=A0A9Q0WWA0_SALPP|nr:AMMONIUM TRANSPORTER [Salix purpurea]